MKRIKQDPKLLLSADKTNNLYRWFKGIKNTKKSSFTKFDIVDFYPSISKNLLTNAIKFAITITSIDKKSY